MRWVKKFYDGFTIVPPIFLDGCLAVGIAMLTAFSLGLAQEDSYKYVHPVLRFWLVLSLGSLCQGLHALSKFRDGTFGKHLDAVEKKKIAEAPSELLKKQQADEQEARLTAVKADAQVAAVQAEINTDAAKT